SSTNMHTPTNIVIVLTYLACLAAAQNPCITSCTGLPDGDYQSCKGCKVFATCWHEKLFDDRPCVGNTVWDDSFKRCELSSATCTPHGDRSDPVHVQLYGDAGWGLSDMRGMRRVRHVFGRDAVREEVCCGHPLGRLLQTLSRFIVNLPLHNTKGMREFL
ncbi:uncharacterized protein LOC124268587, partial [Haliotis rubra]|uniref:uncharacterized protein LOC124268587 n=1 Tax=Haliotis rubra TaxID=36100 RepID=UPI001EE62BD6